MTNELGTPEPGSEWHWNGEQWLWWDGTQWEEAGVSAVGAPSTPLTADAAGEAVTTAVPEPPPAPVVPSAAAATLSPPPAPPPPAAATVAAPSAPAAPAAAATTATPAAVGSPAAPAPPQRSGMGVGGVLAIVFGGLLALLLIGGLVEWIVSAVGGGDEDVVTLQTEPLSTSVAAFTPPMGTDTTVTTPVRGSGVQTVPAETVGLFGGTLNNASCNKDQLVAYLQANPDKAGPWAQTLGITPAQIPTFVASLTPVLLRSDTVVTNHGFENGKITTMPAVLQAGTAVLVNEYGQPVVKCYCGNPLTPAPTQLNKVKYTGPTWPGFQPGAVTVIQSSSTVINNYTLVDVTTNQTFVRVAGTSGTADTPSNVPAPEVLTPAPVAPTPQPTAPAPPTAVTEAGRESQAIAAVQNAYRSCASMMGDTEGVEEVIAGATYNAAPTGNVAGEYSVVVGDSSGSFEYLVNVDTGVVDAVNADAQLVADACPGVFS